MKKILTALTAIVLLASCQKEITDINAPGGSTGSGGGTNQGGNVNGELLVRALEISPATNDTNVISATWDAGKRLLTYVSSGKVQGISNLIKHTINRTADGKVNFIDSKTFFNGLGSDSTTYRFTYNGNKVAYFLNSRTTLLGDQNDSTVLRYNTSNRVTAKETFSDLFGTMEPLTKEEYQYDANGNLTVINTSTANFFTGVYEQGATATYTYDGHKSPVVLGEECFAVTGAANVSKNNVTKLVTNNVSSGTTYTGVFSGLVYNSSDRPSQAQLSVTPQPPGYTVKLLYYYQ